MKIIFKSYDPVTDMKANCYLYVSVLSLLRSAVTKLFNREQLTVIKH